MPLTNPIPVRPPDALREDELRSRLRLLIFVICLLSAWQEWFGSVLTMSMEGACCASVAFEAFLGIAVGCIAGRCRDWPAAAIAICVMAISPLFGSYICDVWQAKAHASLTITAGTVMVGVVNMFLLLASGSIAYSITVSRRRPIPTGFCRACDYNLTGNVSGKCPECGTPIVDDKVLS